MTERTYATPQAFKQALEQRLRDASMTGSDFARRRQLLVFDRFLARIVIEPPRLRIYPVETHIAEKLHAYTMPRERPNTRVKDLPDLALLATIRALDAAVVQNALKLTFSFRNTHPLPASLPAPPATWAAPYAEMAAEDGLQWVTLEEVEAVVRAFLDPILDGTAKATWDREAWRWQ